MSLMCAVCDKPVDRVERDRNILTNETIYTVFCHGEVEVVTIKDSDILDATSITIGRAFERKTRKLTPGKFISGGSSAQVHKELK